MVGAPGLQAQTSDPTFPVNGTHDKALVATVLEHATVHLDATTVVEDGTVILHRGRIVAAGPSATTSFDGPAMRLDMTGLHLYPSFVDVHSDLGTPEAQSAGWSRTPQDLSDKKGAYGWNEAVRPEMSAAAVFDPSADAAKALRDGHMTLPKHRGMPYGGPLCSGSDRLMLEPLPREMDVPWCFRQTFDWDSSRSAVAK